MNRQIDNPDAEYPLRGDYDVFMEMYALLRLAPGVTPDPQETANEEIDHTFRPVYFECLEEFTAFDPASVRWNPGGGEILVLTRMTHAGYLYGTGPDAALEIFTEMILPDRTAADGQIDPDFTPIFFRSAGEIAAFSVDSLDFAALESGAEK